VIMRPSVATERGRSTLFPPLHGSHNVRAPRAVLGETDVTSCPAHTESHSPLLLPVYDQVVRCVLGRPKALWLGLHAALPAVPAVLTQYRMATTERMYRVITPRSTSSR
jgi:hypothetical protein